MRRSLLLMGLLATTACRHTEYEAPPPEVAYFEIVLSEDSRRGSPEAPEPFPSSIPARATMRLVARTHDGEVARNYNDTARVTVVPGEIVGQRDRVPFVKGEAVFDVSWRFSFDETHIWIEDAGEDPLTDCENGRDDDGDGREDVRDPDCQRGAPDQARTGVATDARRATQATGISEPLYFARPRIRDVQFSPRCTTDTPLSGQNASVETGMLIVTGTTQSGLYVTDMSGPEGGYNSVYLFTFGNPGDVRRGDRLCSIAGNAAEFVGNTQLNFPSFVNADFDRNGVITEGDRVPCDLESPEIIGVEAVPEPVRLTAAHLAPGGGEVPDDFYRFCGIDGAALSVDDATDCNAARNAIPSELRRESVIDCARDDFDLEPHEHALVRFESAVVSTRFERCDENGDGRIDRGRGSPEGACEEDCNEDPLCSVLSSLELFGQFSMGVDCQGAPGQWTCAGKAYVSFRDTLGSSGFDPMAESGKHFGAIIGHLRHLQPGAGVPSSWIVEPRIPEDFVPAAAAPPPGEVSPPVDGGP